MIFQIQTLQNLQNFLELCNYKELYALNPFRIDLPMV